ncbi:hypothetical protein M434DRAFT_73519 [Hypoxylon sp. CO27-5]|nr:hypothetical protein M434DRAFT_73519 [Hypoxylon sp. CO27-5]
MFGGGSSSTAAKSDPVVADSGKSDKKSPSPDRKHDSSSSGTPTKSPDQAASGEKRSGNGSPPGRQNPDTGNSEKKRRSSGVGSKASSLIASAKSTLNFGQVGRSSSEINAQTPLQKLGKQDQSLAVPQGQHNNSAGESVPGPRSTFRVGVWEDRNKKCRRTMEDTHAFLYNFLHTPAPHLDMIETDNGYFAIFDGHAGTFAADWCGKKLHLILEDTIRRNPNVPIPELLDQTFTSVDAQLEKLPLKNSGCTAAIAVLRTAVRQRVLYTANVGDARIILCRAGKALRLSYDHKGSDENEGKRIANAGGLILNNRVNGVLAVTRALGDTYMKDLVTGHPYTTETVIQPEVDEFIIIACDGLWDVCNDQDAVDLVRDEQDPVVASKKLVDHALARFSTDNLSCMIVRFDKAALLEHQNNRENPIGVEGDSTSTGGKVSEADRIVSSTKQKIAEGDTPAVGVSASNSGRGHDPLPIDDGDSFKPTIIEGPVEEEPPSLEDSDAPEVVADAIPNPGGLVTPEATSPNTAEPPSSS